jgi:hypothetical protein
MFQLAGFDDAWPVVRAANAWPAAAWRQSTHESADGDVEGDERH